MLSAEGLYGYGLRATDGHIGHVHDFLFNEDDWTIRYLVADTGILFGRRVLLSPAAFELPDLAAQELPVALGKDEIRDSPDIDTDRPVSRQQEVALHNHFGWTPYWAAPDLGGFPTTAIYGGPEVDPTTQDPEEMPGGGDPRLRSAREVVGYTVDARDGDIGSVADMLVDPHPWRIRYLVIDTGKWLPGTKVVLAPHWAKRINWADRSVAMDLSREAIRNAPPFEESMAVDRAYEERLFGYYGFPPYW